MELAQFNVEADDQIEVYSNIDREYDIEIYAQHDSRMNKVLSKQEAFAYRNYHPGNFFSVNITGLSSYSHLLVAVYRREGLEDWREEIESFWPRSKQQNKEI